MKRLKNVVVFGFSLALLASSPSLAVWQEPAGDMNTAGINIVDSWISNGNQTSQLISTESRGPGVMPHERVCDGFGEAHCNFDNPKYNSNAGLILPACKKTNDSYCIESLSQKSGSNSLEFVHSGDAGGDSIAADPKRGLPAGGQVSLWSHESSDATFAIHSVLMMNYDRGPKKFVVTDYELSLVPYTEQSGNFTGPTVSERYLTSEKRWQTGASSAMGCVWTSKGLCGVEADFPNGDFEYSVSVRLPKSAGTWFRGRIASPEISVKAINSSSNQLTMTGAPMQTLKAYAAIPKSEVDQKHLDWLCEGMCKQWFPTVINLRADYPNSPGALEAFRETANDTSVAVESKWSFGVIPPFNNSCLKDTSKVNGFVSTNASVYQAASPSFDGTSLNYRVNSFHFLPDAETAAQGVYNLVINSETARCLYGFSSAPVKAKVQVVGESGEQQIITDVLSESNGWIRLSVAGFHFSAERIKVAFEQDANLRVSVPKSSTLAGLSPKTNSLTSTQKNQIKSFTSKSAGNTKFICTGAYVNPKDKVAAIKRARVACDYAKTLNKNFSYWSQAKQTTAKSYDSKVMLVSK
jgi:hypothetical protein